MTRELIRPEDCEGIKTVYPRDKYKCARKACEHFAQVKGGNCPCCFSRRMTEPFPQPTVVVLCGSTKFYDEFQRQNFRLTMEGKIVLSVGFYPHATEDQWSVCEHGETVGVTAEQKTALDELHKRKIDLADEVFILNVDGYIGDNTRSEIEYAEWYEKPITYLEDPSPRLVITAPKCSMCGRERTAGDGEHPMDSYEYSPLQVVTGKPMGWYNGDDGQVCPEDMEKTVRGQF